VGTLLVIEREPALQFSIKRFFEASGVDVDVCATPADAGALSGRTYDALLVDYAPVDLAEVRALIATCRRTNPALVVVVLAGTLEDDDALDADSIRLKPLPLAELAHAMRIGAA
jgi:DNA-binding response OmpR family regulator